MLLFIFSSLASEVPTVAYNAAESLEERRLHVEKTCAKYNDNLKYEYRALHDVPTNEIFQNRVAQSNQDFDHLNKYIHCELGAWDQSYMRGLRGRSFNLKNKGNGSDEALRELNRMKEKEFKEYLKGYNRLV